MVTVIDAGEWLRRRLSEELRAALVGHEREAVSTIRCVIAAIDNAGAVPQPVGRGTLPAKVADVARRVLGHSDVAAILQAEVDERNAAAASYERFGELEKAQQLRAGVERILGWLELVNRRQAGAAD